MLEDLGNIGDFLGGIGVVVTLAYLAVQIRQNSRSVKVSAAQSVLQSLSDWRTDWAALALTDRLFCLI